MTEAQLRSEVLNLLTAGHETTANALAWTWYLLAQNADVERKASTRWARSAGLLPWLT